MRRYLSFVILLIVLISQQSTRGHQNHSHELEEGLVGGSPASEGQTRNSARGNANAKRPSLGGPAVEAFGPFSKSVSAQVNGSELVIECNAMPEHGMMVGIRAWQQQVPLPQPFEGDNAWRLPLNPKPASRPISVLKDPLRGAIALAVNGVPIFCALNNRSEDTFLAGELDKWGGHCGRGDDYHYHIAPTHLEDQVGIGNPIAFALDGYPILGRADRDGTIPNDLDPFNGHTHDGHYHYHATDTFPYVNGGLHGEVKMSGDQIQQPRDSPMRPGQPPLRGAKITNFERDGDRFDLTYEVSGREAHIKYELLDNERAKFMYVSTTGDTSTEVYQRGSRGRGGPDRGGEGRGPRDRRRGPFGWIGLGVFSFFALGLYAWRNKRIVGHASHDT